MAKVHFIAIGGSAMHNLAIAMYNKGYQVSGSDDKIFDPSRSKLEEYNLLPAEAGWFPEKISRDLDAVILGMHAREDNIELEKARELGIKIYSFPEYLYEQTRDKKRVVIGGSHGKTTITSMVMHVLKHMGLKFDYMVGARLEGFDTMTGLSQESDLAVFEGDEYLPSPIDPRPKFHLYKPHIALISGIAWDHVNVFPTFREYTEQFGIFIDKIEQNGSLVYYNNDDSLKELIPGARKDIKLIPYEEHRARIQNEGNLLISEKGSEIPVRIFGDHNLANISGALKICRELGISNENFYQAIQSFRGAAKRLELIEENEDTKVFLDFAHAPSKLKATISAVKQQYPDKELIAIMELHTFSSLNKEFLKQYSGTMMKANIPMIYFNPETIRHKKMEMFPPAFVKESFNQQNIHIYNDSKKLTNDLKTYSLKNRNLLFMTSGNFGGIDIRELTSELLHPGE